MLNWDKEEIDLIHDHLHLDTKDIYQRFCEVYGQYARTYDSVQKKVKKIRETYIDEEDNSSEEKSDEEVIQQIEVLLGSLEGPILQDITAGRKREVKDEARWWLEGIQEASNDLVIPPIQTPPKTGTSLCVLISDSHIGKQNEHYNTDIAKQRIDSLPDIIISQEGTAGVNEVVLMFLGDIVEGEDIFATQAHQIDCPAITQVQIACEAYWKMVLKFRHMFGCPVRIVAVPGNHGRMSKTAHKKTNWDNVIYHILNIAAINYGDKDITIECNFEMFKIFKVKDKIGMLYHKGVKHTGTPAMREKVAGWSAKKQFDFMCHGHWHEWHVGNWLGKVVISNGCMCGPDDLAEQMAKEDTARQAYFCVTPGKPLHGFGIVEWPE